MSDWIEVASGSFPDLLEVLHKMGHPAYKDWVERGYPQGNAGVKIYGYRDKFRIEEYRQVG